MNWQNVRSPSTPAALPPIPALATAALLLILALAAATPQAMAGSEGERRQTANAAELAVAALGPWETGNRLAWMGLELAAKDVNQAGGILGKKVKLLRYDDKDDVREAIRQAQRIAADPEIAVTVMLSKKDAAAPAATVLAYHGILTMLTRVTESLDEIDLPLLFRMCPDDSEQLAFLADFCAARGLKRIAILTASGDRARIHANTFENESGAHGVSVVARLNCDMLTGDAAFRRELAALQKRLGFDAVFYSGPAQLAVKVLTAAHAAGVDTPFLGGYRLETLEMDKLTTPPQTPLYIVTPFSAQADEQARKFAANFRQTYGEEPDDKAGIGYAALMVYAKTASQTKSADPDAVAGALKPKKHWEGPLYIKSWQNGRFQTLDFTRPSPGTP